MAVNATAVYRVRTGGSNVNGGGYDAGIGGAGTDYSQQDAAQVSGSNGTASGTTTFTDATAANFTAAMVGNAIWIASGAGFTVGCYFVTGYTSSSVVTLDRSPGTGTVAVWKLGGAWADPFANILNSAAWIVPGNTIYVRGSGSNNPTSADYTSGSDVQPKSGDVTNGCISLIGENGRPKISGPGLLYWNMTYFNFSNIVFTSGTGTLFLNSGILQYSNGTIYNCTFDQNGYDMVCANLLSGLILNCEFYSSIAARSTKVNYTIVGGGYGTTIVGCNIHDTVGPGVNLLALMKIANSIVAKCGADGIVVSETSSQYITGIIGCTIDGNTGNGITLSANQAVLSCPIIGNIISNHTGGGKAGIAFTGGLTSAQATRCASYWSGNAFYNNTSNVLGMSMVGSGNTIGTDPGFISTSTENYGVGTNLYDLGPPLAGNSLSGKVSTVDYSYPGAMQPATSGGTTTYVINRITTIFQGDMDYAETV